MSMSTRCPTCCDSCAEEGPSVKISRKSTTLLPVGSIPFELELVNNSARFCDHRHAHDNWHSISADSFTKLPLSNRESSERLCLAINSMLSQKYIMATYRFKGNMEVIVRVYMDVRKYQNEVLKVEPPRRGYLRPDPSIRYKMMGNFRRIMKALSGDQSVWNAVETTEEISPLIPEDRRTLGDIFQGLGSPSPIPIQGYGEISTRLLNLEDNLEGLGIHTTLESQQRRSVAEMLERELGEISVPDPLFIRLAAMDQREYFLFPGEMEIKLSRPTMHSLRGGILCVDLDTGKYLTILTLIAATLNQISRPEESVEPLTPLSYHRFPPSGTPFSPRNPRVPSLVDLMLHRSRTVPIPNPSHSQNFMEAKERMRDHPLNRSLRENTPFYIPSTGFGHITYLTSATLIVVPDNILSRWHNEITMYCASPLRVLQLRVGDKAPSVKCLAIDFDIVLMQYEKFTEESSPQNNSDLRQYFSRNVCSCKPVPICVCKSNTLHPFLQIRWKRLVIYEDLLSIVPQELSTTLMSCVKNICVERRWIVTGNPTTVGVSGLSLGSRVEPEQLRYMTASNGPSGARNASTSRQPNGKWVNDNEKTLIKFENMILNFICVPPPHYPLTKNVMEDNVVKPFLNDKGPELGSVQVLGQILEMIIIRQV